MSEMNDQPASPYISQPPVPIPACQECGRQDETVRLVAYPFVISVVFITFRRSFRGLWCSTHRAKYLAFAGLISVVLGWLGIPFGIIFTPMALYQLAKGGIQPAESNIKILKLLADEKLRKGDTAGAIRCLEECLRFKDDPEARQRLNALRPQYGPQEEPVGCWTIGLKMLGTLYITIMVGMGIGMMDYGGGYFIAKLLGEEVPLFLIAAEWFPFLVGSFLGGIAAKHLLEQALMKIKARGQGLAIFFAVMASLMLTYGIFEGTLVADNIWALATGGFESTSEAILVAIITFLGGGFIGAWSAIRLLPGNTIYIVLVAVATVFFLVVIIQAARNIVDWQKRIQAGPGM